MIAQATILSFSRARSGPRPNNVCTCGGLPWGKCVCNREPTSTSTSTPTPTPVKTIHGASRVPHYTPVLPTSTRENKTTATTSSTSHLTASTPTPAPGSRSRSIATKPTPKSALKSSSKSFHKLTAKSTSRLSAKSSTKPTFRSTPKSTSRTTPLSATRTTPASPSKRKRQRDGPPTPKRTRLRLYLRSPSKPKKMGKSPKSPKASSMAKSPKSPKPSGSGAATAPKRTSKSKSKSRPSATSRPPFTPMKLRSSSRPVSIPGAPKRSRIANNANELPTPSDTPTPVRKSPTLKSPARPRRLTLRYNPPASIPAPAPTPAPVPAPASANILPEYADWVVPPPVQAVPLPADAEFFFQPLAGPNPPRTPFTAQLLAQQAAPCPPRPSPRHRVRGRRPAQVQVQADEDALRSEAMARIMNLVNPSVNPFDIAASVGETSRLLQREQNAPSPEEEPGCSPLKRLAASLGSPLHLASAPASASTSQVPRVAEDWGAAWWTMYAFLEEVARDQRASWASVSVEELRRVPGLHGRVVAQAACWDDVLYCVRGIIERETGTTR